MKTWFAIVLSFILMFSSYCVMDRNSFKELNNKINHVQNEEVKTVSIDPKSQKPGFVYFYFNEGCESFNCDRINDILLTGDEKVSITVLPGRRIIIYLPSDIYGAMMVRDLFYERK